MNYFIKSIVIYLILCLFIIGGCTHHEDVASNNESENMYDVYISEDNERISYVINEKNSDKSLIDENLDDLSVLIYYRYDNETDNEYYVYDFDRLYCFVVNKISWIIETDNSVRSADEEMKSLIISKMKDINAEGWWGDSYDVDSQEIKGWFDRTDYSHIWRIYFCFSNGDVVELHGVGYDGAMYAPEELDEFLKYLRSFVISDKSL